MTNSILIVYLTIVGLVVGSAINAIVWRLNVGRKWSKGRSECPECHHVLAPKDLVPVLSWLWLRGKCRYCRAPIKDSPIVEVLTAAGFGLSAAALAPTTVFDWLMLGLWLVVLTLIIILATYDARWMILPDKIMLPAIGVAALLAVTRAVGVHSLLALRGPVLAAFLVGAAFYAVVALSGGRAMGGGDIKFVFMMGLLLGLKGTVLALLLATWSAALVAIVLIVLRRRGRRDHIPFGPFLSAGTVFVYLYGAAIIHWYMHSNGLG